MSTCFPPSCAWTRSTSPERSANKLFTWYCPGAGLFAAPLCLESEKPKSALATSLYSWICCFACSLRRMMYLSFSAIVRFSSAIFRPASRLADASRMLPPPERLLTFAAPASLRSARALSRATSASESFALKPTQVVHGARTSAGLTTRVRKVLNSPRASRASSLPSSSAARSSSWQSSLFSFSAASIFGSPPSVFSASLEVSTPRRRASRWSGGLKVLRSASRRCFWPSITASRSASISLSSATWSSRPARHSSCPASAPPSPPGESRSASTSSSAASRFHCSVAASCSFASSRLRSSSTVSDSTRSPRIGAEDVTSARMRLTSRSASCLSALAVRSWRESSSIFSSSS
mmetsp:Transcript_58941/g.140192  ORF Transcript_58941/g.140192 Transcript_58941/m.140192 type:complete len:350 (-) Transcript_58941:239-1288(-)